MNVCRYVARGNTTFNAKRAVLLSGATSKIALIAQQKARYHVYRNNKSTRKTMKRYRSLLPCCILLWLVAACQMPLPSGSSEQNNSTPEPWDLYTRSLQQTDSKHSTESNISPTAAQEPKQYDAVAEPQVSLEIPDYTADEDLYSYTGYVSSYNHTTLVPDWVAYLLTDEEANGEVTDKFSFSRDPQVRGRQASREDYRNSGYDKGHMAPRADMKWSRQACYESYFFTNICPQVHSMNAGCWSKLEQQTRRLAEHYGRVYVVTGPLFDSPTPKTIGEAHVAVPDRFFKALLVPDGEGYHAIAFVMHNDERKQSPRQSAMTVDELENLLGRDLFPHLDDAWEAKAEATYNWADWNY